MDSLSSSVIIRFGAVRDACFNCRPVPRYWLALGLPLAGLWSLAGILSLAVPQAMVLTGRNVSSAMHGSMLAGLAILSVGLGVGSVLLRRAVARKRLRSSGPDGIFVAYSKARSKFAFRRDDALVLEPDRSARALVLRALVADLAIVSSCLVAMNLLLWIGHPSARGTPQILLLCVSLAILAFGIARAAGIVRRELRIQSRLRQEQCLQCGYSLLVGPVERAFEERLCPECGCPYLVLSDHDMTYSALEH